jgi:serine-type D-Ala-D-Ala carboxypeptidase/endopeptidase
MGSTSVVVPPERAHHLLAGHSRRGRPRPPIEDFLAPAGSLRASAEDLLRFLAACLTPPPGTLGAVLSLAQQPHARTRLGVQFGLCWIVSTRWKAFDHPQHPRIVWHNGGTWGFAAFAGFAPDQRTAAVTMSNTARAVDATGLRLLEARPPGSARPKLR